MSLNFHIFNFLPENLKNVVLNISEIQAIPPLQLPDQHFRINCAKSSKISTKNMKLSRGKVYRIKRPEEREKFSRRVFPENPLRDEPDPFKTIYKNVGFYDYVPYTGSDCNCILHGGPKPILRSGFVGHLRYFFCVSQK